jgi:hypothetical protein
LVDGSVYVPGASMRLTQSGHDSKSTDQGEVRW